MPSSCDVHSSRDPNRWLERTMLIVSPSRDDAGGQAAHSGSSSTVSVLVSAPGSNVETSTVRWILASISTLLGAASGLASPTSTFTSQEFSSSDHSFISSSCDTTGATSDASGGGGGSGSA